MGSVDYSVQRRRLVLLLLAGGLALLTFLLLTLASPSKTVTAQISPLSPLTVATPLPQAIATGIPSPLEPPQTDNNQSSTSVQNPAANRDFNQSPLAALGEPSQTPTSLVLVGALLAGLGLLGIVVLVVRRRE